MPIAPRPGFDLPCLVNETGIAAKLSAQERVILFCAASGTDHAAVGIPAREMQSMAIRGLIQRNQYAGRAYVLTDSGRAALATLLERAGLRRG
jgi:hypothetical protein